MRRLTGKLAWIPYPALEDAAFAGVVLPLFAEFMASRGQSEQAACLVAVTRIRNAHPQPNGTAEVKV